MSRRELDLDKLKGFGASSTKPTSNVKPPASGATDWTERAGFPSREPVDDTTLTIRLPRVQAHRYRHLAKADRYTLGAFLEILMDAYEHPSDN